MINDLIGLRHETAATFSPHCKTIDCFALFSEVRHRLGMRDYYADFEWVYGEMDDGKLPLKKILRQIKQMAVPTFSPMDGDLVLLPARAFNLGLGVVINGGVLTITEKGPSFWTPIGMEAKFWTPIDKE
jgi:hypothetical protein